MKKFLFAIMTIVLCAACQNTNNDAVQSYDTITVVENSVINEKSVPIFPKKAALTTDTAQRFSVELPMRCTVDWNNQSVVSVVPAEKIEMVRLGVGDPLPELAVSGYQFKDMTVAAALNKLLDGTDVAVVMDEQLVEKISGDVASGTLSDTVDLISKMGRAYYSYDETTAEIHLQHRAKWMIKMPKDQAIIMALLDAMHGADVRNLLVNWSDKTVVFEGDWQTEREVSRIIADIASKKYMLAWDMDVYRVYPKTDNPIIWMNLLPAFGKQNIKMSVPGVVGRALVVGPEINTKTLQEFLATQSNVVLISQGTFSIPNGWQSKFDIGQCSKEDRLETDLVVGATGKYGDYGGYQKIDAKIVLTTKYGELTSFNIPSSVGDNYVIIGIPTHSFVTTPETLVSPFAELVVFMSPRIISVVDTDETDAKSNVGLSGNALREFLNN